MSIADANIHEICWSGDLPPRLNCPFYYQPHPVCVEAVKRVQEVVASMPEWSAEVSAGKMFGVLVVCDVSGNATGRKGSIAYLQAYSGQIGGREDWDGWVPAVFDYLQPDGYFVTQEAEISQVNAEIRERESSDRYRLLCARLASEKVCQQGRIDDYRTFMSAEKSNREVRRQNGEDNAVLVRESQFQKAEFKRLKQDVANFLEPLARAVHEYESATLALKRKRKLLSDELQRWLFSQFVMLNGCGQRRNLLEIFAETPQRIPPSGAGECCAPKLLQYAFLHGLAPMAMAEFWWGRSPVGEIREHLSFYPACMGKCKPILDFMLQGVDVEPNALEEEELRSRLNIVYEDDWLLAIDKPAGMLSVPGKGQRLSAYEIVCRQVDSSLFPVHRLDMQTSGILLFAKSSSVQESMQRMFASREVKKRYVAVLDGVFVGESEGVIDLPLTSDYENRPRQKVDFSSGKRAVTHYIIIGVVNGRTRVELYPQTGRTHQLRVHCAYRDGLALPIVGDDLYGRHADRLLLHAESLVFVHPVTLQEVHIELKPSF